MNGILEVNLKAIAFSLAILAAPFFLLKLEGKKNFRKELLLGKLNWAKTLFQGLKLFAVTFFILVLQGIILNLLGLLDNEIVVEIITAQEPLALLMAVTIGPIGEELLFRGYLLKRMGVVLQAVLFALFHYGYASISEILAALAVGVLLGLYVKKNKDIYSAIAAHSFYNIFSITLVLFYV
ncbi:MAG: type II CAAX endopeptidase family protein [Candidatus Norongarragalinales archaeon]